MLPTRPDYLAAGDVVSFVDADAAGLHVRVQGIAVLAEIENDEVSIGVGERDSGGIFAGDLLGLIVGGVNDNGIGDGEDGLAEDGVALELFAGTGVDAALSVELLPVDGHALADPDASVDGKRGAGVAGGITAGVGGDVVAALQRRADDDDRLAVDGGLAAGLGDLLMAGRSGADARDNAVCELLREAAHRVPE